MCAVASATNFCNVNNNGNSNYNSASNASGGVRPYDTMKYLKVGYMLIVPIGRKSSPSYIINTGE